jgi:uncharacterized membrane protein
VNNYIALYVEKGRGNFSVADVSARIGSNFWQILFTVILTFIMIAIGYIFCFIPGIYLSVSMCFVYIAITYDKKGFGDALSRSFEISHFQWWSTFLLLIVIYLILVLIALIPYFIILISIIGSMTVTELNDNFSPDKLIEVIRKLSYMLALLTILFSFLSVIPMVAIAVQYISLAETKANENQL